MAEVKETKGFIQVYKSTDTIPCEPWFAPADTEIGYPFVKVAPDPKLKLPKYDWNNYHWFDAEGEVQGQLISEMADTLNKLKADLAKDKLSNEAINEQLGTLVELVSADAIAQQAASSSTDNKADSTTDTTSKNGGAK